MSTPNNQRKVQMNGNGYAVTNHINNKALLSKLYVMMMKKEITKSNYVARVGKIKGWTQAEINSTAQKELTFTHMELQKR
jgi:hypothetical protein